MSCATSAKLEQKTLISPSILKGIRADDWHGALGFFVGERLPSAGGEDGEKGAMPLGSHYYRGLGKEVKRNFKKSMTCNGFNNLPFFYNHLFF